MAQHNLLKWKEGKRRQGKGEEREQDGREGRSTVPILQRRRLRTCNQEVAEPSTLLLAHRAFHLESKVAKRSFFLILRNRNGFDEEPWVKRHVQRA